MSDANEVEYLKLRNDFKAGVLRPSGLFELNDLAMEIADAYLASRQADAAGDGVVDEGLFELTAEIESALRQRGFCQNDGEETYWFTNSPEQDFDFQYWPELDQFRLADSEGHIAIGVASVRQLDALLAALGIAANGKGVE